LDFGKPLNGIIGGVVVGYLLPALLVLVLSLRNIRKEKLLLSSGRVGNGFGNLFQF